MKGFLFLNKLHNRIPRNPLMLYSHSSILLIYKFKPYSHNMGMVVKKSFFMLCVKLESQTIYRNYNRALLGLGTLF